MKKTDDFLEIGGQYPTSLTIQVIGDRKNAKLHYLISRAKLLFRHVTSICQQTNTPTFSLTRQEGNDYIKASIAGTTKKIQIYIAPTGKALEELNKKAVLVTKPVTLYSGLIKGGTLNTGATPPTLSAFAPTQDCIKFNPNDNLFTGFQNTPRLAITPSVELPELNNQNDQSPVVFSQYTKLKACMYSGLMAKVVQVIMGLGKLDPRTLIDITQPGINPTYYNQVKASGFQVHYDYKFRTSHTIYKRESDGVLWLLSINQQDGVLAMKLPVFPGTYTPAFRQLIETAGDETILKVLDDLGCIPTGEPFPTTDSVLFNKLKTAGDIIQLATPLELKGYFECSPYSDTWGWSSNDTGSELHNTGLTETVTHHKSSRHYMLRIQIGADTTQRQPGEAIASGSAILQKVSEGRLSANDTLFGRYLPFKYPSKLGLLSFDASGGAVVNCDTTMFVCHIGGQLHLVKFYRNEGSRDTGSSTDGSQGLDCLLGASWVDTTTGGASSIPAMMYTNVIDDRRELIPFSSTSETSVVLGSFSAGLFSDRLDDPNFADVFRTRNVITTNTSQTNNGDWCSSTVVVPAGSRDAYYYVFGESLTSQSTSRSVGSEGVLDPNVAVAFRWWLPLVGSGYTLPAGCKTGECGQTKQGPHPRQVVCIVAPPPSDCTVGAGSWVGMCDDVDNFNGASGGAPSGSSTTTNAAPHQARGTFYSNGLEAGFEPLVVTFGDFNDKWQYPSPDPLSGIYQQMLSSYSTIGEQGVGYDTRMNDFTSAKYVGILPTQDVAPSDKASLIFVGVLEQ